MSGLASEPKIPTYTNLFHRLRFSSGETCTAHSTQPPSALTTMITTRSTHSPTRKRKPVFWVDEGWWGVYPPNGYRLRFGGSRGLLVVVYLDVATDVFAVLDVLPPGLVAPPPKNGCDPHLVASGGVASGLVERPFEYFVGKNPIT